MQTNIEYLNYSAVAARILLGPLGTTTTTTNGISIPHWIQNAFSLPQNITISNLTSLNSSPLKTGWLKKMILFLLGSQLLLRGYFLLNIQGPGMIFCSTTPPGTSEAPHQTRGRPRHQLYVGAHNSTFMYIYIYRIT